MRLLKKKFHDPSLARMAAVAAELGAVMAAENPPYALQASSHSAALFRLADQAGIGGAGVVGSGDLQVAQNGTPNMSVNVAAGQAVIPGTLGSSTGMAVNSNAQTTYGLPSGFTSQGSYYGYNDAAVNLAIAAANASNPRIDLIVASVQDAQYSGSNNQWVLQVVTGTPGASPVAPAAPANSVVLAEVLVGANVTSIVSGNITDKRPRVTLAAPTISPQVLNFTPGSGLNTPASGTATWVTVGNITVPAGVSKARIFVSINGILESAAGGDNVKVAVAIGAATGPTSMRLLPPTSPQRGSQSWVDTISSPAAGTQPVTIKATFVAGTSFYAVDANSLISVSVDFLP